LNLDKIGLETMISVLMTKNVPASCRCWKKSNYEKREKVVENN